MIMDKFDPESMPETTSPTVRALRTFVERTIESEVQHVIDTRGEEVALVVESALRNVVFCIFHNNPDVHSVAKGDMYAFDSAIEKLFKVNKD